MPRVPFFCQPQHMRPRRPLWLALLLTVVTSVATAATPKPFSADYKARYGSLSVDASRSLTMGKDRQMEFRFAARHWLADIDERSLAQWDDEHFQLRPQTYSYNRTGLGRDRTALLTFDHDQGKVTNNVQNKPWSMDVPTDVQDKLSYQLQLRADLINGKELMEYQVADGGRLKTYRFAVEGEEVIDTPVGRLNTVRVKRLRKDNDRVTLIWLARDWDYLIVRIQQTEDDGKYYEINLTSAKLDGVSVNGL
ncbi:DUF3108 domain-containing protein [Pseudomaricurvus sp. HS19]|uniref:DUF3108 domain-containing protein n=1 Tax=Pseudomaricurvus sp. HS19 TaxID=2692626 RepID=UPI00136B4342|nr:DUF3108 domain-containing protein [Pseudomaricurvus sp. HS19]MYM65000.1 DUF3108 domain-containing protein [Pseudomaricurvus sp. HS19]